MNSPFLSYLPFFLRRSGCVRRSCAVHDFGEEISFDAIEAAIDLGLGVAVRRYNPAVFGCDHDSATGAAKSAGRLIPFQFGDRPVGNKILRAPRAPAFRPPLLPSQQLPVSGIHGGPLVSDPYGHLLATAIVYFAVVELIPHPCRETPVLPSARPASSRSC